MPRKKDKDTETAKILVGRPGAIKFTSPMRERFLVVLATTGNVRLAAIAAKVSYRTAYLWKEGDAPESMKAEAKEFAADWQAAERVYADLLEAEADRRARVGVSEPVVSMGRVVTVSKELPDGTVDVQPLMVRKYSDSLLLAMLKAKKREQYADQVRHAGPDGKPLAVAATLNVVADALVAASAKAEEHAAKVRAAREQAADAGEEEADANG